MSLPIPTATQIIKDLIAKNLIPPFDLIDDPNGDYARHAELRGLDGQWAEAQALVNFSKLTSAKRAEALQPIEASALPFEKPSVWSGQGDKGMSTVGELLNDRSRG